MSTHAHTHTRRIVRRAALRAAAALTLALVLPIAGCETMNQMLDGLNKPTASIAGVSFGSLSMDKANLVFDIDIQNPYDVPLPLANLEYGLASKGASFVSGQAELAGTIPARGSRTVQLPVDVVFADVLSAVSGVRPGKLVPYEANMTLSVDAPGVGPLALPLKKTGEVPVPAPPKVALKNVDVKSLNLQDASAVLELEVENTNEFAAALNKLSYALDLGGASIASASVQEAADFQPGKAQTLRVPVSFKTSSLGLAALNVLRGQSASYSIRGDLDVGTQFGSLSMPFNRSGSTSLSH